jgi:uncharacterized protein (TIGR03086 family)
MSDVINRVTPLISAFDARVQAVPADAWSKQSPCAEWTTRDVVVHVGNALQRWTAAMAGTEVSEIGADEEIVGAWNASRDGFLSTMGTADLSADVPTPFGPMPAEQAIGRLTCTDVLVHTWDLARAAGLDETLDADAVAAAYSGLKPMDAMIRMPGVFGPKVDAPNDADAQTEFLTFLVRNV